MSNDKLTIEELSEYLPYGVKFVYKSKVHELVNIHYFYSYDEYGNIVGKSECTRIYDSNFGYVQILISGIKPLLRPLSQLTTEIEVNGEKFVPIEKLEEMYGITIDKSEFLPINLEPYNIVRQLHRWHFDTFNLLKRGLAEPFI